MNYLEKYEQIEERYLQTKSKKNYLQRRELNTTKQQSIIYRLTD